MKKIVVWTLVLAGLLIAFVLILYSCSNEADERLGPSEETTQQETVSSGTVEQYEVLPPTGGLPQYISEESSRFSGEEESERPRIGYNCHKALSFTES